MNTRDCGQLRSLPGAGSIPTVLAIILLSALALVQFGCAGGFTPQGSPAGFGNTASGSGSSGGTITVPPPTVSITVTPSSASVAPGGQVQLTALVTNTTNTSVTWSVNGVPGGNSTVGTISSNGTYQAPAVPPVPNTVTVTAVSNVNSSAQASAIIVIAAPPVSVTVSVSPPVATMQTGATMAFSAQVSGTSNTSVSWSVNGIPGGNATFGTITATGIYTAPAAVPAPAGVTVTATSAADPTSSGLASVTIQQRVQVSVSPPGLNLLTSAAQQFAATVTGTATQTVTWAVNGVSGGNATVGTISSTGLYTAPAVVPTPSNTVSISATSTVDPNAIGFASATITLSPGVIVTISPLTGSVDINQSLQFTGTATGIFRGNPVSPAVNWYVNNIVGGDPTIGTIDVSGRYTAPASVPFPNTVTITAASVTDPSARANASVLITAPVFVTVAVVPVTLSLQTGTQQQFTASVSGTANTGVNWAVNGIPGGNTVVGSISPTGLYTAPAAVPTPATVSVTATSVVDPSAAASAAVSIQSTPVPITVSVSPTTTSLRVTQQLQFNATVTGSQVSTVTWAVNAVPGGNATLGIISPLGVYTAPVNVPSPASVTVTATSTADPTKSGSAIATILPTATISMSPSTTTVQTGLGVQFFVTVIGVTNTAVNYAVNGVPGGNATVGTISVTGLYQAPATVPTPNSVTVSATNVQDPTLVANSTVTINPLITLTVAPTSASIAPGQTQQFTSTVTGTGATAVTWSVNGQPGGNSTVGTIDATGLYTAPTGLLLSQSFTVTATLTSTGQTTNAQVFVNVPVVVSVSPTSGNVQVGRTQQLLVTVSGSVNTAVNWTVNGIAGGNATVGTISTSGLYTAPAAAPSPATVTVTATSVADPTKSASSSLTVLPGVSVSVAPAIATLQVGATQQFVATVLGTANTAVTWAVSCGTPPCGTVDSTGLYTAPASVSGTLTATVTATSAADPTKSAGASVTVQPPIAVSVSPGSANLIINQGQQFMAAVTGTANTLVNWTLSGASCSGAACGTISGSGLYIAPGTAPAPTNTVTVTATSVADPTKSATATVTVTAPPSGVFVTVFPRDRNLPIGKTQKFTAQVIRTNNSAVTWSVNGIVGGNSTVGTIDPTGLYMPPNVPPTPPNITITATSQASPTASMTVNARVVVGVTVTPASAKLNVGGQLQFSATVASTTNTAVVWAVNGITGGDPALGTISPTGLYTAPGGVPRPGILTITATSVADPTEPGVATLNLLPSTMQLFPSTATLLPGASLMFKANSNIYPTATSAQPLVQWAVNGIVGGNATVGTISPSGVYVAPTTIPSPATVTVAATSTVLPTTAATASVTIAVPTGASPVSLLSSVLKVRPYDVLASTNTLSVRAASSQYVSWQVLVEGRNEDLTGVNVSLGDFTAPSGNRILSSNGTIYLEKYVNIPYVSRAQSTAGEWPDPLIPKTDPFVNESRNAFPFGVNRISPAYKIYPRMAGDTVNSGMGDGRAVSGGTFSGSVVRQFVATIDRAGAIGSATFKWSNDGGVTFQASNVPIPNSNPITLSEGVTIAFLPGSVAGVTDFSVGDSFWVFAGPTRLQPVWIDFFVPANTPPGDYTGNVTVVRAGKTNVTLPVTITVENYTLPVSSSFPAFFGMNWTSLLNAHYLAASGAQTSALGQLYGQACLINRISCDTASTFPPLFTFNADGTVATKDYTPFVQATAPLANGSNTLHGEQLSLIRLPRVGSTPSEQYFATQDMLAEFTRRGWRLRTFDFSFDEPVSASDFLSTLDRTSLVRSVDPLLLSAVTTDIARFNYNLIGYVNAWTPNWTSLENKEFLSGPNPSSRSFYNRPVANGDQLWWYESCLTHGCGATGTSPLHDDYPSFNVDAPAEANRAWGLAAVSPYNITGLLGQNSTLAYSRFYQMSLPRVDVWDSVYYLGGNGDGTLFYPGRPSDIGGTTHIPIESLRLKMIRDALITQEVAIFLRNRGEGPFVEITLLGPVKNLLNQNASPNVTNNTRLDLLVQAGNPSLPPAISVPARGGCYIDPVTGNRVCRVTDRALCANGGQHNYSYWPNFNSTGTHFTVLCNRWANAVPGFTSSLLLIRESDLAVIGDALEAKVTLDPLQTYWAWTDPNIMYGYVGTQVWSVNPFTKQATMIKDFAGVSLFGQTPANMFLAYVSFDDRFFLIEFRDSNFRTFALAVYDKQTNTIVGALDPRVFVSYDESVFTKDNHVWVIATDAAGNQSFRYNLDFTGKIRVAEHGHHAHGLLPNGTPVAVKSEDARSCPPGSPSGIPGSSWKPSAIILDERVDTSGFPRWASPLASELFQLACNIPGQHTFQHFSWNNTQRDRFFISSLSYSGFATDPVAYGILRARLQFDPLGNIIGDQIDLLAHSRSDPTLGYWAYPRVTCNQQGSRCIFDSSMTIQTDNLDSQQHVYIVYFVP